MLHSSFQILEANESAGDDFCRQQQIKEEVPTFLMSPPQPQIVPPPPPQQHSTLHELLLMRNLKRQRLMRHHHHLHRQPGRLHPNQRVHMPSDRLLHAHLQEQKRFQQQVGYNMMTPSPQPLLDTNESEMELLEKAFGSTPSPPLLH